MDLREERAVDLMEERAKQYLVDAKGEGGLVCELDRSPMVDEPTLIIGLGGTGIDAMLQAKYIIQRKMIPSENRQRPSRLAFLAVDTDEKAFADKRVGDVSIEDSEKLLINEPMLASYMKNPDLIPQNYQREWLCKGINADNIKFGAGGIRQCGRFMFINRASAFVSKVSTIISEIWGAGRQNGAPFPPSTPIHVYVLTGVGGGTGSGTFLDAAYLLREIVTKQTQHHVNMRGFIFMPDVNLCAVEDETVRNYIKANGYAALRELDFWMDSSRGRNFRQQYLPTITIDTDETPFDLCFLVSPNGSQKQDYENCMKTAGETMMNILSASEPDAKGSNFGFESYITNLQGMKMAAAINNTYSGNYIYGSMGMDEQRLQLDSMANYLAYRLLMKVDDLFLHKPMPEQVEELFSKKLKLDWEKGLWREFDKAMPKTPFDRQVRTLDDLTAAIASFNHNTVLKDRTLYYDLENWERQCHALYNQQMVKLVDSYCEMLFHEIETLFEDLRFGPYYAHRMLHNIDVGEKDLLKRLNQERESVLAFQHKAADREEQLKKAAGEALESANRNKFVPLIAKGKYDDYVQAEFDYFNFKRRCDFAPVAYDFYTRMIARVTEFNNLIVERFARLLKALTEVFRNNSDIMTNVSKNGNIHTWNVGNFGSIRETVDRELQNLKNQGKEEALIAAFLNWMMTERKVWVGDEGNLGRSFSRFVSSRFSAIMSLTMEQTYAQMYDLTTPQQLQAYIQGTVMPRLHTGAKVLYTPDAGLHSLDFAPARAMISVPSGAVNIALAVQNYVNDNNIKADVYASQRVGSLFWFQGSCALPLFAHDALPVYQTAHDVIGGVDKHLGRYLKMSQEENWLKLIPPLMPETTWKYAQYQNPEWSRKFAGFRRLFDLAWENGLVVPLQDQSNVFVLADVDEGAYNALINAAPVSQQVLERVAKGGVAAALGLASNVNAATSYVDQVRQFLDTGWTPDPKYRFKDDNFNKLMGGVQVADRMTDQDLHDRQILSENLLWTPDMATRLYEQLRLKEALKKLLSEVSDFLTCIQQAHREMQNFADALTYGLYRATGPKVFQLDTSGTGQPTFMLMTIDDYKLAPSTDPFYALFLKYLTLTVQQKQIMANIRTFRSKQLNQEMNAGNNTRYNNYCRLVRGIVKSMQVRLNQINMNPTFDRPEIRDFYQVTHGQLTGFLP